jgi:hypothetical protein
VANARFLNKKLTIAAILSVGLFSAVLVGTMSLASAQQKDAGNGEAPYNHGPDHAAPYNHGPDHAAPYNHGPDHART